MTTEPQGKLEALKQAIRAAEEMARQAEKAMVALEPTCRAEPQERPRPPQPLARATPTVRLPDDASALVTIEVIVCDENDWYRRPESNEAGWSCMSVGPVDVATRIIGF